MTMYRGSDLYLKVEPLRKRLTVDARRIGSVFTDLRKLLAHMHIIISNSLFRFVAV